VPSQPVTVDPSTTTMRAQNNASTPSFWNRGLAARKQRRDIEAVASQAVAIQKMPIWVCTVRLTT
jgi:hypothetical protein